MSEIVQGHRLPHSFLRDLYQQDWRPNLKIPLFYALLSLAGFLAWTTPSAALRWALYACMGYLWMGVVTFMHDACHGVLFRSRWKNWAFGVFAMLPILVTFVSFKEDHLEHHRHNRSAKDPDSWTMGRRSVVDFLIFYAYLAIGGILTLLQFTLIYPVQKFDRRRWLIHGGELLLRVVILGGLLAWAARLGVLERVLAVWLIPIYLFTLLNSMRFIGEHYDTPWEAGQLSGTRTISSNPINSFFWNNINFHIGHHVYPAVPWYNLQKLHGALLPEIERAGAVVDSSYLALLWKALRRGPESPERNAQLLAERERRRATAEARASG